MARGAGRTLVLIGVALTLWTFAAIHGQEQPLDVIDRNHAAIRYAEPSHDAIASFLRTGTASRLSSEGPSGYLASLLRALDVPVSSQILVFSKGSVQSPLIDAHNPRALYFNDSTVVGWVRGGFIEIAAQDAQQGTVFYRAVPGADGLSFTRSDECLRCHHSARTAGVVGVIEPMGQARPLERRWGGWYVTGHVGSIQHYGNVDVAALTSGAAVPKTPTLLSLEQTFDTRGYLSVHSDVAALLVFEHQMQMMNLLTRLGWETRIALNEGRLDRDNGAIRNIVEQTADYMLFIDEAPIPAKIEGSSGFAEAFSRSGPRDGKGRSLRQLDLANRLQRYPCSYTIYSAQFEQLPAPAKLALYQRLWTILSGKVSGTRYNRLTAADRRAILDILRATKSDLPMDFQP